MLKSPTARVPQMPHTKCTEIAPTGSSIFNFESMVITASTTRAPATRPMITADITDTVSAPAVMPTKPARQPFNTIERSGFFCNRLDAK